MPRGRRPEGPIEIRTCAREGCKVTFEVHKGNARTGDQKYCSRTCSRPVANLARAKEKQSEWYASEGSWCPCKKNQIPYEVRHSTTYCSLECRRLYQPRRQ